MNGGSEMEKIYYKTYANLICKNSYWHLETTYINHDSNSDQQHTDKNMTSLENPMNKLSEKQVASSQ